MINLVRDNKIIKNVKIPSEESRTKILDTAKIVLFSSLLGLTLISAYKNRPKEIDTNNSSIVGTVTIFDDTAYTYEDILYNEAESLVKDYAYVFNLKDEVVLNAISQNLANSTKKDLRENYNIIGTDKKYDNLDVQVILTAKDLIKNPSKYGYSKDEIYLSEIVESDLTIRELVYKYADAFNLDRDIVLSISCAESGWFKENIATKKNNPYSYRLSSGFFASFDTLERGILEGELNLKENYFDKGLTTIDSFARIYCPESTVHWLSLVKSVDKDLKNGKKLYDEKDKRLVMNDN